MSKPAPETKPTVAIIGAGRLGTALAIALQSSGYAIDAVVARRRAKAQKAAALLRVTKRPVKSLAAGQLGQLPRVDLVIISTPDDSIADTAERLEKVWPGDTGGAVLHTSGALSSHVLSVLRDRGLETGSIHPLVSISDPVAGAESLNGAFYCLEGTPEAEAQAKSIVRDLGGSSFSIKPEKKALYHAAAVMASPHMTALFDLALNMLASCGLSKIEAQKVFVPLLESTVNNLKVSTPQKALTGTFARGDVATVRRHLEALSERGLTEAAAVYELLGLHSLELAIRDKADPKRIREIRDLLEDSQRACGAGGSIKPRVKRTK